VGFDGLGEVLQRPSMTSASSRVPAKRKISRGLSLIRRRPAKYIYPALRGLQDASMFYALRRGAASTAASPLRRHARADAKPDRSASPAFPASWRFLIRSGNGSRSHAAQHVRLCTPVAVAAD
jgi:hypothetical protein